MSSSARWCWPRRRDWSVAANIAASIAGLAILIVAFGLVNLARGRPFLAFPHRFGWPELAVFALAPAVLPLIFGGQLGSALATVVGNVALVGLVYVIWGYGLPAIVRWAGRRVVGQLATSLALLARALGLLGASGPPDGAGRRGQTHLLSEQPPLRIAAGRHPATPRGATGSA